MMSLPGPMFLRGGGFSVSSAMFLLGVGLSIYLSSLNHEPSILMMRHDGQKRKIIRKMCI